MRWWIDVLFIFTLQFLNCNPHVSCYERNSVVDRIDSCDGFCVLKSEKFSKFPGGPQIETAGCQLNSSYLYLKNNKNKNKNKCASQTRLHEYNTVFYEDNIIVSYEYQADEEEGSIQVNKVCCTTAFCNDFEKVEAPLQYLAWLYADAESIFLIGICCSLVIVCTIFPLVTLFKLLIWRSGVSDEDYIQIIDPYLIAASEEFKVVDKNIIVTGQMNIEDTATVFLEMIEGSDVSSAHSSSTDNQVIFNTPQMVTAGGHGHSLVRGVRSRPFYLKSALFRMIEHGPVEFPFKADELLEIFDEARDAFFSDPPFIYINHSVVLIGDLRGSYADLHRWLQIVGWPPRTRLLFLGNLIDKNEPGSIDTLALVCCLKIAFPQDVFVLRGSCEAATYVPAGRFDNKIADALGGCIARMCNFLPAAAIVMDKILAVPSGISPLFKNPADVKDLDRPASLDEMTLIQRQLLFSRPSTKVRMFRPKDKSRGDYFGITAVDRIREHLGVSVVVRGSTPVSYGYLPSWNHTLITLWSAPGKETQMGSVLMVTDKAQVTPILMKAQSSAPSSGDKEEKTQATRADLVP